MKTKRARTLTAIYTKPTFGGIVCADIEALVVALGGSIHASAGSRIAFKLNGGAPIPASPASTRQSAIRWRMRATGSTNRG